MQTFLKNLKSWKTSSAGLAGGLYIGAMQLMNMFDDDPTTIVDKDKLAMAVVVVLIGYFSKDGDKSSKQLGLE